MIVIGLVFEFSFFGAWRMGWEGGGGDGNGLLMIFEPLIFVKTRSQVLMVLKSKRTKTLASCS